MKKNYLFYLVFLYIPLTFAETSLTPGIYRIIPEDWQKDVDTSHLTGNNTAKEKTEVEVQHAIPASSHIKYAVVSRVEVSDIPDTSGNKIMFLEQNNLATSKKDTTAFCKTYAWASGLSNSKFYCYADKEYNYTEQHKPYFKWSQDSFAIRWVNKKQLIDSQYIPAQRKPTEKEFDRCFFGGGCDSPAYDVTIKTYRQTYYNDVFKLETPKPYKDILYLNEDMPMYQKANQKSSVIKQLHKGDYVAFISKTPNWYKVDDISADAVITQGWINRDDLIKLQWYPQKAKTPLFRFEVGVDQTVNAPVAIAVIDRKTNVRVQVLRDIETDAKISDDDTDMDAFKSDELISLVDANFDQYPDLFMYASSGGASPNDTGNYFLYDPKTQRFVFNEKLSSMSQLGFDPKNHTVTTSQRASCCDHYSQTYRFINNQFILIETWENHASSGKVSETTGTLKNGKMHYKTIEYNDDTN